MLKLFPVSINSIANSKASRTFKTFAFLQRPRHGALPEYMKFRYSQAPSSTFSQHQKIFDHSTDSKISFSTVRHSIASRPLVILFAWMLSEQAHIEKYREFWLKRGYDILTVQTSPWALLFPYFVGSKIPSNVYNFIAHMRPKYDEILVHAFSVGGFQFGQFLHRLYRAIESHERSAERIAESIKGIFIDSVVFSGGAAQGLSRAITNHPVGQPILEKSINLFLQATKPIILARYKVVESHIIENRRRIPAMMLFSRDDIVSDYARNYSIVEQWERKGIKTKAKCWEQSGHVLHYKLHPEEYEQEVDQFVKKLNITKANNKI